MVVSTKMTMEAPHQCPLNHLEDFKTNKWCMPEDWHSRRYRISIRR